MAKRTKVTYGKGKKVSFFTKSPNGPAINFDVIWSWLKSLSIFTLPNWGWIVAVIGLCVIFYLMGSHDAPQARCDFTGMINEVSHYKAMADTCGNGTEFMLTSAIVEWRYIIIGAILLAWILNGVGFSFVR